ncbi:MAG: veratrol--corrinoid protein metyltransferase, partial [Oscillospiraceae bacterium]|nr:veratrol--corrinoid protein metyltransferase [Oscillospiraceae bacterium]
MAEYKKNEKQNYLGMLRGEEPEWLQWYKIQEYVVMPGFMGAGHITPGGGIDIYGVEYVSEDSAGGGALPKPGVFILDDIRKWRDVIKNPVVSDSEWAAMAKEDLKGIDTSLKPRMANPNRGCFQMLMSFMGFTEGMCALAEEPEECMALFDYMSDFAVDAFKAMIKYYEIDGLNLMDDNAAAQYPFISVEMYRKLIKPFEMKLAVIAHENNLPIHIHDCGHCEQFIDDWIDLGITSWDPAQISNDLKGIKAKYGRGMVLNGCWDQQGRISLLTTPDAEFRDAIVEYIDTYAPGGAFGYVPFVLGRSDNPDVVRKNAIIQQVYDDYGRDW